MAGCGDSAYLVQADLNAATLGKITTPPITELINPSSPGLRSGMSGRSGLTSQGAAQPETRPFSVLHEALQAGTALSGCRSFGRNKSQRDAARCCAKWRIGTA
jgi:hypothetical protein